MCPKDFTTNCIINTVLEPAPPLYPINVDLWGLKSFGARDFSPENSSDEGLKSLAPTKTVARQTPIWRSILWDTCGLRDNIVSFQNVQRFFYLIKNGSGSKMWIPQVVSDTLR